MKLVGLKEISEMTNQSLQSVYLKSFTRAFPLPVAILSCGRVWKEEDIIKWLKDKKK